MLDFSSKWIQNFDIFGSKISLNYEKNDVYKSSFGGIVSLSFIAFIALFFWNNIISFVGKENVYVSEYRKVDIDPPQIKLNINNFMFAVKIDHDNFLNKPLFNLTLEQRDYVLYANGTRAKKKFPIPLQPCTEEHWSKLASHGTNWTQVYKNQNFQTFLCPKIDQELNLGGNYNSEHFYHLKFSVSKCSNNVLPTALWKPTCATDQEITNFFNQNTNVRFNLYINNYILNPLSNQDYVSSFVEESLFFSVQRSGAYQTADIFFTQYDVKTDESILPFQDIKNETYLIYQNANFRGQYVIGPTPSVYADFYIRKDSFSNHISRSFQKISEIISYIGGFCQIFILISAIIVNFYNEYLYSISLANKIYDFQFTQNSKKRGALKKFNLMNSPRQEDDDLNGQPSKQFSQNRESIFNSPDLMAQQSQREDQKIDQSMSGVQVEDIEANIERKLERLKTMQVEKQKDLLYSHKKGRIQTREEDGLLPLDQLKSILYQRKKLMTKLYTKQMSGDEQEKDHIKEESKNYKNNFKTKKVDKKEKKQKKQEDEQIIESEKEFDSSEQSKGLHYNVQKNNLKIQQKENLADSIEPETPKEKKNLQFDEQKTILNDQLFENKFSKNALSKNPSKLISDQQDPLFSSNGADDCKEDSFNKRDEKQDQIVQEINSNGQLFQNNVDQSPISTYQQSPNNYLQEENNQKIEKKMFQGLGFKSKEQFLKKEFEFLLKRDSSIKMTYKFFLYKLTCGKFFKTEEVLLLEKATNQMRNDLDIFMIINKIKELDKFKCLILKKHEEILFNFFPKPIISIQHKQENLSRAEIEDQVKNRSQSISISKRKSSNIRGNSKKLNVNLKTAVLVSRAANQFKKPILERINNFNNINAYKALYDSYQKVLEEGGTEMSFKGQKKLCFDQNLSMNRLSKDYSKVIQSKKSHFKIDIDTFDQSNDNKNIFSSETPTTLLNHPTQIKQLSVLSPKSPE